MHVGNLKQKEGHEIDLPGWLGSRQVMWDPFLMQTLLPEPNNTFPAQWNMPFASLEHGEDAWNPG